MSQHELTKIYFDFQSDPFSNDIAPKYLLKLPSMSAVKERLDYTISLGGIMVVTGEVGSGKSTSLRWAQSHLHPSQFLIVDIVSMGGSPNEFYKQLCWGLHVEMYSNSRTFLVRNFKKAVREIVSAKKQKIVFIIDEAHLLRSDTFGEIHTLTQFEQDSKNLISIIFAGQTSLLDKLTYRSSQPIASRVMAKTHITAINHDQMYEYLEHHLTICGVKKMLFSVSAVTAIHQGSAGILRKANALARGSLIAAAIEKQNEVSSEHVRIASTELM